MLVKELDVLLLVFPVSVVVEPTDLAKLPSVTCAEEDGKKIIMQLTFSPLNRAEVLLSYANAALKINDILF